ncbi:MAG: hypothetical protein DUW69_001799 [Verrucomicrobia bacterium]|nr:MAG: hypothetical protein DUW69_001799 [Verrucomicrobiota bacterium]
MLQAGGPPTPDFGAASGAAKPSADEAADEGLMEMAGETGASNWPDESAETAFQAESRARSEPELPAGLMVEASEETSPKGLPALEDLVKRIPPEARELLDELFRAKFTGVRRVPEQALKR